MYAHIFVVYAYIFVIYVYIFVIYVYISVIHAHIRLHVTWQFALKMLPPQNPPNQETQISRYTFKLNQYLNSKFAPRDTEQSKCLDVAYFGGVSISVETVLYANLRLHYRYRLHAEKYKNLFVICSWYIHIFVICNTWIHNSSVLRIYLYITNIYSVYNIICETFVCLHTSKHSSVYVHTRTRTYRDRHRHRHRHRHWHWHRHIHIHRHRCRCRHRLWTQTQT